MGDFTYDVGLLQFLFPGANYDKITPAGSYAKKSYNSTEVYLSGTWQWLNVKYSRAITDVGCFGFTSNNAGVGAFPGNPSAGADYWKTYPRVAGNGTTKDMSAGTWIASVIRTY